MTPEIQRALHRGELVLFIGAGASCSSTDRHGRFLPSGSELAREIAEFASMTYVDEELSIVYSAALKKMGDRLWAYFQDRFTHCQYSKCFEMLVQYPWARIYTTNIDDALDRALNRHSRQVVTVRYRFDRIDDQDQLYTNLDLVKLNGSADRRQDGLIFSAQEYGKAAADDPRWYAELADDYFRYTFLFVGTRLREPLFYHHIERYRMTNSAREGLSFVLTREASEIERESFASMNLQHLPGTLEDFCAWLQKQIPTPPSSWDVAVVARPELAAVARSTDPENLVRKLEVLEVVSRKDLARQITDTRPPAGRIRDFYRGFKPTWSDIADGVPARLDALADARALVERLKPSDHLFAIHGPAGSGKTTTLMQLALELGESGKYPCYSLRGPVENLDEILEALESTNSGRYVLFVDRLSMIADGLLRILSGSRVVRGIVIGTERENVWKSRTGIQLRPYVSGEVRISTINSREAAAILPLLEKFGNWTRLRQMHPRARLATLMEHAERQLLIGLLEATSGRGFLEIIEDDYATLTTLDQRRFVALVGLATVHRLALPEQLADRALHRLGIYEPVTSLLEKTSGIVDRRPSGLLARHQIYVERLFDGVVSKKDKLDVLIALLHGFTAYRAPILASVRRSVGTLYKLNVNHNFLRNLLEGDVDSILQIYSQFEKAFQADGLFWLQYGLALRDAKEHARALEVLQTAKNAYPIKQTGHALAQQQMIMASMSSERPRAYALLAEAKEILSRLDERYSDERYDYPLVTLSEHHTDVVRTFEGDKKARPLARDYANTIEERMKKGQNPRLRAAWKKLTTYATGGAWSKKLDIYSPSI